ncbi:L-proline dehydrogenase [Curtobacterium sp. PhB142]|uniref:proline dehydrogenase family protein n=1 Tax=unclassified Curtobacterium TaxID=257496 RepID=UPI001046533F|nr:MULTISPECIES: bifunctional proline dehydrogenase/L-glutamate gamma-semialdehyde dehydrogenase [unclassified Curtobacterium]TCL85252.1 L-proline dehydrogenase [Curtobacterium sp. PhB142]TCM01817.1 L-proline dehydrogenase [Curtobacterium sp. PhB134]TCU45670.1 L-proline dehydrogenase [Curtobacterium sp. PhB146]TDW42329.1 L-proline dehydrogenase [Curtobacterium sp. PhB42]TDW52855.1 L-proline dehydrogenase [Curtobacterium sp. PhB190]
MTTLQEHPATDHDALADQSVALVRQWLAEAESFPVDGSAKQLAGVLADPAGLDFAVGFVDGVVRPEDLAVAARKLRQIAPGAPGFLPAAMRGLVRLGGGMAPVLPGVVVPIARRVLRGMVGHLIVDATDSKLGPAIAKIKRDGVRLNVNLLGEAVLGEREAARRLEGTHKLLARDDVDYVSIKVSSTVHPHSPWAFDHAVDDIVEQLRPLFERAVASTPAKFINLDMEEYKDLDLTIAVFTKLLDEPAFLGLEAGIVLQAYLPDALAAMEQLQEWSAARRARGGAGIKVRLVKGANLPMEQVEASVHGWPLATWHTKQDSDTNYKRVLDWALTPSRVENVRVGVAGHNLFDVAHAWLLAGERGVRDGIEFEMLLGMAQGQASAVKNTVGSLLLYTPVVHPGEFDVAIAYLIRRLEEGASQDNFMSAVFSLVSSPPLFAREEERFRASLVPLATPEGLAAPASHRVADRYAAVGRPGPGRFENTPDSDPSVAPVRQWGSAITDRIASSTLGVRAVQEARVDSAASLDSALARVQAAGAVWGTWSGAARGAVLHAVGDALEANRAALIEVMAAETGKTIDQADPEVSEAIDFAHFYGSLASQLDDLDGATFTPATLTLVAPPWNFPVAIPAGSTLAALAAGSAVVLKPAPPAERSGAVLASIIETALDAHGAPADVLAFLQVSENELGQQLIASPMVDQVILTGAYETAELFRSFRSDLPLLAETSGKNAVIVTPSSDLDLAVKDVVASAFGHAGQKCSAASLVVMVGSVAKSKRFRNQLLDAVSSLTVGSPTDPTTQMGPIIEPASGKLLAGLTTLGAGETWAVEPKQLDETGKLWSPGVRQGVRRGSEFHRTEYFGPILGMMTADTLDEAIDIVNEVDYGLTSGLHSLDPAEIGTWLSRIQAGNLYVNRGITGAIVRRQPFGGWKKSAVGAGTKAGGLNYLLGLGSWAPAASTAASVPSAPVSAFVRAAGGTSPVLDRSLASDEQAWSTLFGTATDVSALSAERNIARYLPFPSVQVRLASGDEDAVPDLVRVVAAALRAGTTIDVSTAAALPTPVASALRSLPIVRSVSQSVSDESFASSIAAGPSTRVRLIGGDTSALYSAIGGRPDVAVYGGPVTEAGRLEILPFVREQAVSITAHRFGTPNHLTDELI